MEKKKMPTEKLLGLSCILFILIQGISILFYGLDGYFDLQWTGESIVLMALCIYMYASYTKHSKNVMKPLIGAALGIELFYEMSRALYVMQYFDDYSTYYDNSTAGLVWVLMQTLAFIAVFLINIYHYKINASHYSNPAKILINRKLFAIYFAASIGRALSCIFLGGSTNMAVSDVANNISGIFIINMIIVIELTMETFKINREDAGWTEEKGYPEGYVHEFEKKQK